MPSSSSTQSAWGVHAPRGWHARWLALLHSLPAGAGWRRVALWLRKPLKNKLPDPVDVTVWGLKLRLRPQGNLSEQRLIFMPQYLDRLERDLLARELSQGGVFFDIGANAGVYTLSVAAACGPKVRVEAFEPDPELCVRLNHNLATNHLSHVHLNQLALGRKEGTAVLVSTEGNKGENRVEAAGGSGTAVAMTTLPKFLKEKQLERIDALKIDVEGFELDVLEPLFDGVPKSAWPRLIVCELAHDPTEKLPALLARHGYHLSASSRLNGVYRLNA